MNDIELKSFRNNEIAKYCGWSMLENANSMVIGGSWIGYPPKMQIIGHKEKIPNYFQDLNVMHEVEKVLDGDIKRQDSLRYTYSYHIYTLTPQGEQPFRATCSVRAESFLKTINKWNIPNE